ncbi:alginate export protein [Luteibacter rhizovicinus]|uniref:Alginate export protein n=1 Tax=Luteibacter rhizovicinus TaxID=242606 RepID=A0A4R3YQE7_9GAMM|nr:alginate export family protein [Luteibacter rhizovicinus]TCV93434.1 alginate export protein [Luteibacter rhizovicinus]
MPVPADKQPVALKRLAASTLAGLVLATASLPASAQTASAGPARPAIMSNRWQEDWSVLADPQVPRQAGDSLKYISLSDTDPQSYLSLGATIRERFEYNASPSFGTTARGADGWLIDRKQVHVDFRPNEHWQWFTQLEDARTVDKALPGPADHDRLDVEQAFIAYVADLGPGELKLRLGRQEMSFDLQRFVSARDGPNVRQAFDALWGNYTIGPWRLIGFWSHPVQYRDEHTFDDYSNRRFQYGGLRVERQLKNAGELSAFYSRWLLDDASYLDAKGRERRNIYDVRYAGKVGKVDWDLESMLQNGSVGSDSVHAWAIGARGGYSIDGPWTPRLGLQADAASGDRHPHDGELNTFNPLFPNGYYFNLGGYTGYTNLIHVKPSVTVKPRAGLTIMAAVGFLWRMTTADAVYVQPNIPVARTAGEPGRYTGAYGQLRIDWLARADLTLALEAVHYRIGPALERAGGHDSNYLGVEFKYSW